jgi:hypothetical protein
VIGTDEYMLKTGESMSEYDNSRKQCRVIDFGF